MTDKPIKQIKTPTQLDKLDKKIKTFKNLEIACLAGVVSGLGLAITGDEIDNNKFSFGGVGIMLASEIGVIYTANKKIKYTHDKYLEEKGFKFY